MWEQGEEPWDPYVESSYGFITDDPLGECSTVRAILVHKDAGESFVVESDKRGYYENGNLAATVDALMTTTFDVEGTYDKVNKRFSLAIDNEYVSSPIFNCTVTGGLTANAEYQVILLAGDDASSVGEYVFIGTVTANSSGGVSFACTNRVGKDSRYYAIRFKNTTVADDWKRINLGTKALESKVYNISRAASADPDAPAIPTITGATYTMPNEYGHSWINGNNGALTFSIAGTSRGVSFIMEDYTSATVTLSNLDAKSQNTFLGGENDITIVLDGNSAITAQDGGYCIFSGENLKLKTTGSTQTLIVTADNEYNCGLYGYNNYNQETNNNATTTECDVTSQLAADGYTVTRSARSESGGKYTWTYTVAPALSYTRGGTTTVITDEFEAQNGDVLTGTLAGNYQISIADGATVTLSGVTINPANGSGWAVSTVQASAALTPSVVIAPVAISSSAARPPSRPRAASMPRASAAGEATTPALRVFAAPSPSRAPSPASPPRRVTLPPIASEKARSTPPAAPSSSKTRRR